MSTTITPGRIAILDRGISARRVLRALRELTHAGQPWVPVVFHSPGEHRARFVREGDETVTITGGLEDTLRNAQVTSAWVGPLSQAERLRIAEACTRAGVRLICAPLEAQRSAGRAKPPPAGARVLEVLVVRDLQGGTWSFEPTLLTHRAGASRPLAESPAPVSESVAAQARALAEQACAAAGWQGLGAVHLVLNDGPLTLLGIDSPEGATTVEASAGAGVDLVRLQLSLFTGLRLTGQAPRPQSVALSVAVHALNRAPHLLELQRLPSSPGVRCDAAAEEGDEVAADGPLLTVVARGADRKEATARLQQALLDTDLLLHGGGTDKEQALASLDPSALKPQPEVALLLTALEAYEEGLQHERSRFLAEARRGLPHVDPAEGRTIELRLSGQRHLLRVLQTGPGAYSVSSGGAAPVAVQLERAGRFERLLWLGGRRHRALVDLDRLQQVVELAGVVHVVQRDPTGVVSAPTPAVVVSVDVSVGEQVEAGALLARVESMKLQVQITAPWAGVVREVLAVANDQVDAGAPLVRLEPSSEPAVSTASAPLQFPPAPASPAVNPWHAWNEGLRRLLLGFDVAPQDARALARTAKDALAARPDEAAAIEEGRAALACFAEVQQLFSRTVGPAGELAPLEELWRYLLDPKTRGEGLSAPFLARLQGVLSHHGVSLQQPSRALELALLRLWKAHERAEEQLPALLAILEHHVRVSPAPMTAPWSTVLEQLALVGQGRFPALADLARELRYRVFDQPALHRARDEEYVRAEADLAVALGTSSPDERSHAVSRLVSFRFPLATRLIEAMAEAGERTPRLVEALLRRYYRIRELEPVTPLIADGVPGACTWYARPDGRVRLCCCYSSPADLPRTLKVLARFASETPATISLSLEIYLWNEGTLAAADAQASQLQALLEGAGFTRPVRRVSFVFAAAGHGLGETSQQHFSFRSPTGVFAEERRLRGAHPNHFERLQLRRFSKFALERMPTVEDVYLYRAVAHDNPKDERLFACAEVRDVNAVRDERGQVVAVPHLERVVLEALAAIRVVQAGRPPNQRLEWNRILLHVIPELRLSLDELRGVMERIAPSAEGLGLEVLLLSARMRREDGGPVQETLVRAALVEPGHLRLVLDEPTDRPLEPVSELEQRIVALRRRGLVHPAEVMRMLTPLPGALPEVPPGEFQEYDLDEAGALVPVKRPPGKNAANVVVGVVKNFTARYPEGMQRVVILGDASREMGSVSEPECRRILLALDLAEKLQVPAEWFALSAGAKISTESGTENMDWVSRVLRRIITYTQAGHELNVVVCGITVGAQPYWNAEATMLMHTKGILVMVPGTAMVLTGKQALEYSGAVSAADNEGIGGYERIMGPNGQAQYQALSLPDAIRVLLAHHEHCYRAPGERFPRRAPTSDPRERDVCEFPHGPIGGANFATIGEVFSEEKNPGRNRPFDIRRVMSACVDQDHAPLERWRDLRGGETTVVWDAHLGGQPLCLIGVESRPIPRTAFVPADGPDVWTAGTLFPQSSRKVARAINAASGNRPLVVLANLSGFDGSPESMRQRQLEYGAEIGRSIVNFQGPVVFCVVSRYHGGAFVVFSKTLREEIEVVALEGSRASVIGGAPAAAVVFSREVDTRTKKDPRVKDAEAAAKTGGSAGRLRLAEVTTLVRSEKLGEVGAEFDAIHTIERARKVGSVDRIITVRELRPWLIEAVERGVARTLAQK